MVLHVRKITTDTLTGTLGQTHTNSRINQMPAISNTVNLLVHTNQGSIPPAQQTPGRDPDQKRHTMDCSKLELFHYVLKIFCTGAPQENLPRRSPNALTENLQTTERKREQRVGMPSNPVLKREKTTKASWLAAERPFIVLRNPSLARVAGFPLRPRPLKPGNPVFRVNSLAKSMPVFFTPTHLWIVPP